MRGFIWLGRFEAISLLLLFFVAMPIKYLAGQPEAVRWVGLAHGLLFLAYMCGALVIAAEEKWSFRTLFICFVLSCLPLGTFFFERKFIVMDTFRGLP